MKNKNIATYLGILAFGLLLGYLFFGNSSGNTTDFHSEASEKNQMWTCSMHPQIMKPEPGDCPICGMGLIPAETSSIGLAANEFTLTKNAMALANIQTSIVGNAKMGDTTIKLSGKIAANEEENAVQVSYFSGRIEQLNVNSTGEKVNKGQLLATIYSPELFAAQQELLTASSVKESQPELYQAVRNKLKLWKISENQINQIEKSGKIKQNFPVYATISGTVSEKLVSEGESIKQGQALLKIANLNTVWANFDVYENQIDAFKKGQNISVRTKAYPNTEFTAKISFIDPILNTKTRTVILRAELSNNEDLLKPGMFITGLAKTTTPSTSKVILIPSSAVLWTGERSVVYLKTNPDLPTFEMRVITLGNKIGDNYQVIEGLQNGDEIVTNGTFTVDAAAQLNGKKSMMNQKGGKVMTGHDGHFMNDKKEKIMLDSSMQQSFFPVIDAYIELKNAFIKSDINVTSKMSDNFRIVLETVPVNQRKKINNYWFMLHKSSKGIHKNIDIFEQRKQFLIISEILIEMVKHFDTLKDTLYVQFCPMADSNKGANWLSKEEKVRNPYFGDAMLTCGEVKQILK